MRKSILEIADIRVGHVFKGRMEPDPDGYFYVLGSDSVRHGVFDKSLLVRRNLESTKCLCKGDVLVSAKSAHNKAYVFDEDLPNVVATSFFHVLSIKSDLLNAEYLCWYINHPDIQRKLSALSTGMTVRNLSKKVLSSFVIDIPSKSLQEKIVSIDRLAKKEEITLRDLADKKIIYWNQYLMGALNEEGL